METNCYIRIGIIIKKFKFHPDFRTLLKDSHPKIEINLDSEDQCFYSRIFFNNNTHDVQKILSEVKRRALYELIKSLRDKTLLKEDEECGLGEKVPQSN